MKPEQLQSLRALISDNAAFESLQEILFTIEKDFQREQAEIRFQASLLDQVCNAVIATDVEGKITYWSRFAQTLYQWSAEEVLGRSLFEVLSPPNRYQLSQTILSNLTEVGMWRGELVVQRKDSSQLIADFNYAVIRDEDGTIMGFVGISIDATERMQGEAGVENFLEENNSQEIEVNSLNIPEVQPIEGMQEDVCQEQQLIKAMASRILQYGNLEEILHFTVSEVQQFLEADRVLIYRFEPEGVAVESLAADCPSLLGRMRPDLCGLQEFIDSYQQGHIQVLEDIYTADLPQSYLQMLSQFQVQAQLVIPILQKDYLSPFYLGKTLDGRAILPTRLNAELVNFTQNSNPEILSTYCHFDSQFTDTTQTSTCAPHADSTNSQNCRLWGLLMIHQCRGSRHWQPREIDWLSVLSAQLEMAIQQAQLYKQTQLRATREQALIRLMRLSRNSLALENLFTAAVQEISQLLSIDHVEIHQYLPDRKIWLTVAEHRQNPNIASCLGIEIPDIDNEIRRQLKQLEVVRINHSPRENHHPRMTQTADEMSQMAMPPPHCTFCHFPHESLPGSWLLVPLHFQGHLWGSLCLSIEDRPYHWEESEVEWVCAVADQLGMAIQQTQLYQQIATLNTDLEHQVQERTLKLRQRVKELEQLNVLKDDFLCTVSHELRTPMMNMKMAIQMLKVAPTSDRRQLYLEILQRECARETELINDLLDLQRLEAHAYPVSLEPLNLQEWLISLIEPFRARTEQQQQILEVDLAADLPTLVTDGSSLGRIVAELLNNACKYTSAGEKIILRVSYHFPSSNPMLTFSFSNQAEIPSAELPRIFDKFYRIPNADPWKRGGTGLGLALVKKLTEQLEGNIHVESGGGWTTFSVQIPVTAHRA